MSTQAVTPSTSGEVKHFLFVPCMLEIPAETLNSKNFTRFDVFHRENPQVYEALVALCRETKAKGFTRYSIAGIFELFRWQTGISTTKPEGYKIANDLKPHYARLIMRNNEDLNDFFETRAITV